MGDHVATIDMDGEEGGGLLCPLLEEELRPHVTYYRLGRGLPPCKVESSSIRLFRYNGHGP